MSVVVKREDWNESSQLGGRSKITYSDYKLFTYNFGYTFKR